MRAPGICYVDPAGRAFWIPLFSRAWHAVLGTWAVARLARMPHATPEGVVIFRSGKVTVFQAPQSPWQTRDR